MEESLWNGTGGEVIDSSTSGVHDGTAVGNATTVEVGGPFGRAGTFDGSGDWVNATNATALNPSSDITLEGWIKLAAINTTGWQWSGTVLSRKNCYIFEVSSEAKLGFYSYALGAWLWGDRDMRQHLGEWTHVAATYDGSDKILYLNGGEIGRQVVAGSLPQSTTYPTAVGWIDYTRYFDGQMDQVGIHGRALLPQEIKEQATLPLPQGNVLLLHMEEPSWNGTPNEVTDSSGMNHHGQAVGTATTAESEFFKLGRAGMFDGNSDYVNLGNDPTLVPTGDKFTFEAWVKPEGLGTWLFDEGGGNFVDRSGMVLTRNVSYYLEVGNDGRVGLALNRNGGYAWLYSSISLADGEWAHLVARADGPMESIWINGVKVAEQTRPGGSLYSNTLDTVVGYNPWHTRYFQGMIDEVAIYDWALSATEIQMRYQAMVPEPSGLVLPGLGLACSVLRYRRKGARAR